MATLIRALVMSRLEKRTSANQIVPFGIQVWARRSSRDICHRHKSPDQPDSSGPESRPVDPAPQPYGISLFLLLPMLGPQSLTFTLPTSDPQPSPAAVTEESREDVGGAQGSPGASRTTRRG